MGFRPRHILIKKFIPEINSEALSRAEADLNDFLQVGFPSISLMDWPRPSFNDLLEGGSGVEIPRGAGRELIVGYFGTRRSLLGAYLLAYVALEKRAYLSVHSHKLDFISRMLSGHSFSGLVVIGMTNPDLRCLGVISGRRSDVFAYWLGQRSRLDRVPIRPGDEGVAVEFNACKLAEFARKVFREDDVVHVSGWSVGWFLRKCFCELSEVMTPSEFEVQFGGGGVKWRPRWFLDFR